MCIIMHMLADGNDDRNPTRREAPLDDTDDRPCPSRRAPIAHCRGRYGCNSGGNKAGTRGLRLRKGKAVQLQPGVALYAEDGDLGPIHNAGAEPLVVLALVVVSEPARQIAESVEMPPAPAAPNPAATPDDSADSNRDD
jgi:hypothetical protein